MGVTTYNVDTRRCLFWSIKRSNKNYLIDRDVNTYKRLF